MSTRSFHFRNFLGGMIGGIAGILAFGSTGFGTGLLALIVCACLGFLLGFYWRDLPAHLRASVALARPLVVRRRETSVAALKRFGNGLAREWLWVGLFVGIGYMIASRAWHAADSAHAFSGEFPYLAWVFLIGVLLWPVLMLLFLIRTTIITLVHPKPTSNEIVVAFLQALGIIALAVTVGPFWVLYQVAKFAVKTIARAARALRYDRQIRIRIAILGGVALFFGLNVFFALFVGDVLYQPKVWVNELRMNMGGIESGHYVSTMTLWQLGIAASFILAAILVPVYVEIEREVLEPRLTPETSPEDFELKLARFKHDCLRRRAQKLEHLGLVRYLLAVACRLFAIQFGAIPFVAVCIVAFVPGIVYLLGAGLPLATVMVFLRTLPKLNSGRHWAGLITTVATTLASALLFRDVLTGRALLLVALGNGLMCGAMSVAVITAGHAIPTRYAWAAKLKDKGVFALLDPTIDGVLRHALPGLDLLLAPVRRLQREPGYGI